LTLTKGAAAGSGSGAAEPKDVATQSDVDGAKMLAIVAIVVGAVGVVLGAVGLTRRRSSAS
jgi:hypothetical protein